MEGFIRDAAALEAFVIRYEDLVAGKASLDNLERHLNITVDRTVLNTKVGSSERGGGKAQVNALEKWLLRRAVAPLAEEVGYSW